MFTTNYYCLVAGLKEYSLDADTKGFDAKAIVGEILEGVDGADADAVRLLYGYYDCENIASLRAGRSAHNPLGNFTREELEEEVKTPRRLPAPVARVLRAFADPEGEDAEEVDTAGRFESALFGAYYEACSRSRSRFLRAWSEFDRNLRNVTAAGGGGGGGGGAGGGGGGAARPESYWYDSSLYYDELVKTGIGTKALERVLRKLGQRKVASGKYTMIVDNMNSSRLLSPVIGAIYGSSIQQKNSFLLDKIDQKVASDKMTLIDEPHLVKASGARYFDSEGVATKRLPVFEQGILKTYYIDTYSANKMGMEQTIGSPSILTMRNGDKDLDGLIASIDKGILVTGFNGGNCNSTTGDFSYGVEGFLIERGKLSQPISEMNATGNMLSLWSNLAEVGNDPRLSSSWRIPSLLFNGVDFSGL